ncbi:hypothetical protein B5S30_g2055 [[Candida] boidinii]|nr:hypothetical protein B5S30_g2055 [[Candida] boidinii]GMF98459.1 unnamed protein product [[Candida] boidinii]
MAGSQLKRFKETFKTAGLTGQTNVKSKGKTRRTPNETRKDDKAEILRKVREEVNPFDFKVNRGKRTDMDAKKIAVGKPGISKQVGEDKRRTLYNAKLSRKNKAGGLLDKRIGEYDKDMTPEERMLERFTKERQAQASKSSIYNLASDDEDGNEDDFSSLTHFGQSLSLGFKESDGNGLDDDEEEAGDDNEDDGDFFSKKRSSSGDVPEAQLEEPVRKKTKAEVMKELIAKSKHYKHERQMESKKLQEKISELDDDFNDIMADIRSVPKQKETAFQQKSEKDIQYDMKVRELALDRRAVPSERTKTDEELAEERKKKMAELEAARLRRMEGLIDNDNDGAEKGADDLDDDFWDAGSDNEEEGFKIQYSDEENDDEEEEEQEEDDDEEEAQPNGKKRASSKKEITIKIGDKVISLKSSRVATSIPCPSNLDELLKLIGDNEYNETIPIIKKVFEVYQPKLAIGNKELIGKFGTVLLDYTLYLSDIEIPEEEESEEKENFIKLINFLVNSLKSLCEKYPEVMCSKFREIIGEIHERIINRDLKNYPEKSDLIFYTIIGDIFSTSDLYHLVVTPTLIVIGETFETLSINKKIDHLFSGIYLLDLLLQYQRISKRIIPEAINFLERAFLTLIPEPEKIREFNQLSTTSVSPNTTTYTIKKTEIIDSLTYSTLPILKLSNIGDKSMEQRKKLLIKLISVLENYVIEIFKEKTSFLELVQPFIIILKHLIKYYASFTPIPSLLSKIQNLVNITERERVPLRLQAHRAVSIATYAPKFEENFNPDKKSYDPDQTRQEISKLRHQIKQERKAAVREMRRDTQFEAREQIKEKKKDYEEYHSKMARIINTIASEEGAEKNAHEREKRARKNK